MSRTKGLFNVSSNYEVQIAAPFDARLRVGLKADLTKRSTWVNKNGAVYLYNGMLVSVWNDTPANNGVYFLRDITCFDQSSSWVKLADNEDIPIMGISLDGVPVIPTNKVADLPLATSASAGLMSAIDKQKLDSGVGEENVIEQISVGGTAIPVDQNKNIDLPLAVVNGNYGLVKIGDDFITGANGQILISPAFAKKEELADIAITGNVNDIVQTVGDELVLNCN